MFNLEKGELRIFYSGEGIDSRLDKVLEKALKVYGYASWASGYNHLTKVRDLAFSKINIKKEEEQNV